MKPHILLSRAALAAAVLNAAAAPALTLVKDGQPQTTIVIATNATRAAQLGAFEVQAHLREITGATVPITNDTAQIAGALILIGDTARTRKLGIRADSFKSQEHLLRCFGHALVLIGRDKADTGRVIYDLKKPWESYQSCPGLWDERGSLDACYDFLERDGGVRWFNPTEFGTYIPTTATLVVSGPPVRRTPTFAYRYATPGTGSPAGYDAWTALWQPDTPQFKAWEAAAYPRLHAQAGINAVAVKCARGRLFQLRRREGGERALCNHSFQGYYDRFWKKNANPAAAKFFVEKRPEYFAQGYPKDTEPPQMCYTDKAFINQVAQDAVDYLQGKKTGADLDIFWPLQLPNPFPLEPMDNSSFCRCADCQKWIAMGKDYGAGDYYSKGIDSDYFFHFVNAVAQEVEKTIPHPHLVALAYNTHAWPPRDVKLAPSVAIEFCFPSSGTPANRVDYENELRLVHTWADEARVSGRTLYLWLYDAMNRLFANGGHYYCFPDFYPHAIARQMKLFQQLGYRGMFFCGYPMQADAYLTYRLMDDANLNADQLLDEYFTDMYGEAAAPMKKLYLGIEKTYSDPKLRPAHGGHGAEVDWGRLGTAERMAQFGQWMAEAKRLATTNQAKHNVELFDLGVWQYMTAGRAEYVQRMSAPIPSVRAPAVPDAGGDPSKVAWDRAAALTGWFERGSDRPASRKLTGRMAHDGQYLYVELMDPCATPKLVVSPEVFPYDDWEIFTASQRSAPYRQFAVGSTGAMKVFLNGEINWRMLVPFPEHKSHAVSDTTAPEKWVARVAIPLSEVVPGGAKVGNKIYLNVIRVASPALGGDIDSWVPYTTVHELDRLAAVTLVNP